MIAEVNPSHLQGSVAAPPSKSAAHRYLIASFLSGEKCTVDNVVLSEDIKATLSCLESLGANVKIEGRKVTLTKEEPKENILHCRESGSTLRFLIPFAMTLGQEITFKGSEKLFERPLDVYETIAKENGFYFEKGRGFLRVCGNLKSGDYRVRGDISSQFITGLLFTLPLLSGDSKIEILPPFESRSYVNITLEVLHYYGVSAAMYGNTLFIKGDQKYRGANAVIEGDYSNAAYLAALDENITVTGLSQSAQGDSVYIDYYKRLKDFCCLDISDCPDLGPALLTVAAMNHGVKLTGTARLSVKESDRAETMKEELKKLGIDIEVSSNEILMKNPHIKKPLSTLSSHNDHRILMALIPILCKTGGKIEGAEAVSKSFPDYFGVIAKLGADIDIKH